MLEVTIYTHDAIDGDSVPATKPLVLEAVNYVSLYNGGTHGPPALVAPRRDEGRDVRPTAREGERVLYINTSIVPMFEIERLGGDSR